MRSLRRKCLLLVPRVICGKQLCRRPRKPRVVFARMNAVKQADRGRLRGWWARQLEKRRRAPIPPAAPSIPSGGFEGSIVSPAWFDTFINITLDHGAAPVATIEVWYSRNGGSFSALATIPSTDAFFRHLEASQGEDLMAYRIRYVNRAKAGGFSADYEILITL